MEMQGKQCCDEYRFVRLASYIPKMGNVQRFCLLLYKSRPPTTSNKKINFTYVAPAFPTPRIINKIHSEGVRSHKTSSKLNR